VARKLAREVLADLPRGRCPVLVHFAPVAGWAYGTGVALQLERRGWDVRTDEEWRPMTGRRAVDDVPEGAIELTVSARPGRRGPGRVIASAADVTITRSGPGGRPC